MSGLRRTAMVLFCAAALPGLLAGSADAAKPKAKGCKKGTIKVKTGKATPCVKLRAAPLPPAAADRGKLVIDRALSPSWPALRDRRGRRVSTAAQALRRAGYGATAKLRAAVAKGLALTATRAHAAEGVTGVSDGDGLGFNADIQAGDYRIFAEFRSNDVGGGVTGPKCPTGAGVLEAKKKSAVVFTLRILDKANILVQATSLVFEEDAAYRAQAADDAKFDTLDIDSTERLTASLTNHAVGVVTVNNTTHRHAVYLMRDNAYRPDANTLTVTATLRGVPPEVVHQLEAEASRRAGADFDRHFADVAKRGKDYTTSAQDRMLAGDCAHLAFDPASPTAKTYKKGDRGQFTASVEPDAEPGGRPPGRFTVGDRRALDVTPASATGTAPQLAFTVTDDRAPMGTVAVRATSKAGMANGTYVVTIGAAAARYRVSGLTYTDQLSGDGIPPYLGCTQSTSQTNSTTLTPSPGTDADGSLAPGLPPPQGSGDWTGLLLARGHLLKTASFNGCQWNDTASARVPCNVMSSGSEDIFVAVDLVMAPDSGPVQLSWHVRTPGVGDVPPVISACEPFPLAGQPLPPATSTEPRATFLDAGVHTVAIDVPADVPGQGGIGVVHSHAHYAITFERLPD